MCLSMVFRITEALELVKETKDRALRTDLMTY